MRPAQHTVGQEGIRLGYWMDHEETGGRDARSEVAMKKQVYREGKL